MRLGAIEWGVLAVVVVAGLGAAGYGGMRWRRRQAEQALLARFREVSTDLLRAVLVPDTAGGYIHCDFVLLTRAGLVVVDLRDVSGIVFGGRYMDEWTVMDGHQRRTFVNPIEALHDRVAAVKQLVGEVPVEGRIVFTPRGRFPKGLPPYVAMLDRLAAEFPPVEGHAEEAARWEDAFATLRAACRPSPLARR